MTKEQIEQLKERITMVKRGTKVSQIMVSRIVKNPRSGGDVFISMTANYGSPDDTNEGEMLSLEDAKLASHLLGKEVNILAHEQAGAGGIITLNKMESCNNHIRNNFKHLITKLGDK